MTTLSRPVIYDEAAITAGDITADDTNINGGQWSRLLRFAGTGPSSGYALTLSTVADTATLSTGWGIWNGYTCEITVTHTVSLPPVATAKTYSIGVQYDPANLSTPEGPLAIVVYDKAAITLPSGGLFWTIYEVDRTPSQSLSVSTVRNMRIVPATTIYVPSGVSLPPPGEYSYGTVAVTSAGQLYRRLTSPAPNWSLVTDDTGEVSAGFTAGPNWTNPGCSYQKENGLTTIHIRAVRSSGSLTASSTGSLVDNLAMTIPGAARSTWLETGRGSMTLGSNNTTYGFDWRLSAAGLFTLTSTNPNLVIDPGTNLFATVILR